ncbi:hypothetical protein PHMEG_00033903 [Phytophthora megakarya]|uniref:Uncharacterized protein n=1 Tax=Phytophthora megakarya TaxID=4795 RepID=A0A225US20_9STRA|nr:hypothetical protein PHMEG_00033903 [Phytophthora megakarya]
MLGLHHSGFAQNALPTIELLIAIMQNQHDVRGRVMECENTQKFTINQCGTHNNPEKDSK